MKRSNDTHASTTDPDARLCRKAEGRECRLCFMGQVLMENRNGLAVGAALTHATGTAEREATLTLLDRRQIDRRFAIGPGQTERHGGGPWTGQRTICRSRHCRSRL